MKNRSQKRHRRGITLLELLITMTIAGVLMAIAVPSYRYVTNANRIAGEVNGLLGDMQFARGEAVKEGQTVTVCVSSTGTSCNAGATTWQSGWIVFSDVNGDHAVEAGDVILRVQPTFTSTDTFVANNNLSYVIFNREGFATGLGVAGAQITLHAATATSASTRCLSIATVGLMTVQTYNQVNNGGATCL